MLSYGDFVGIFFNKKPVEMLAAIRITVKDALIVHAKAFFPLAIGFVFEVICISIIAGLLLSNGVPASFLNSFILGLVLLILIPVSYAAQMVFGYLWAAMHFFVAGMVKEKEGDMNDFAVSSLEVFSCVKFVECALLLIPVIGWVLVPVAHFRGLFLYHRFLKAKLAMNSIQAGIVTLVILDFFLLVALIFALIFAGILLGPKIVS